MKSENTTDTFNFITINHEDELNANLIIDLLEERITGILIKNFLNKSEVSSALEGVWNTPYQNKTRINDGFFSHPITFAQFTQLKESGQLTIDDYCKIAHDLLTSQEQKLGYNVVKKLCNFLNAFDPIKQVSPIINKDNGQELVPFTIRELLPGKGELIIHCENLFFKEFPEFFNLLKWLDIKDNKLSYFITLSQAETGGELCCFDLNWNNIKTRVDDEQLQNEDFQTIKILNNPEVKRFFIKPEAGDLLLFAGGNVWHRVEKVGGFKSRITLGGFIAETNTPGKYYIWS
jgi:hypothetical protein